MLILCFVLLSVILLYLLFDVHYFVRMCSILLWGRLFQKRKKIFEKTVNYGICLTTDVDVFLKHMNNARYLRELDFARSTYYCRSGIFGEIRRRGWSVVQGATSIRYRRPVPVFKPYKITTRLIYWDKKSIFIEHTVVTLPDQFLRTIALSKQTVIGTDLDVPGLIGKLEPGATRPELTAELRLWMESLEESSLELKRMRALEDKADSCMASSAFIKKSIRISEI